MVSAIVMPLVLLIIASVLFWQARRDGAAQQAERSRQLAALSKAMLKPQAGLSLLFAIEAARISGTEQALASLCPALLDYAVKSMKGQQEKATNVSNDGTARLWSVPSTDNQGETLQDLLRTACSRATRNMTLDERGQYMGSKPYRKTCTDVRANSNTEVQ